MDEETKGLEVGQVRMANGRFLPGHKMPGPGRPPRAQEERYHHLMLTTVTEDDWVAIVAKAREQAIRGNPIARKWLSDYILGTPVQRIASDVAEHVTVVWDVA